MSYGGFMRVTIWISKCCGYPDKSHTKNENNTTGYCDKCHMSTEFIPEEVKL